MQRLAREIYARLRGKSRNKEGTLKNRLEEIRKQRGIRQEELAEAM